MWGVTFTASSLPVGLWISGVGNGVAVIYEYSYPYTLPNDMSCL